MNDNEINIAISVASKFTSDGWVSLITGRPMGHRMSDGQPVTIPDYCNDLNAMHDVVVSRCNDSVNGEVYGRWLVKIVFGYDFFTMTKNHQLLNAWELARLSNASAKQCATAYLETLNLWKD